MRTAEEVLKEHFNVMIDDIEVITDAMKEYARESVKEREGQIRDEIFKMPLGMPHTVSAHLDKLPEIELP